MKRFKNADRIVDVEINSAMRLPKSLSVANQNEWFFEFYREKRGECGDTQ